MQEAKGVLIVVDKGEWISRILPLNCVDVALSSMLFSGLDLLARFRGDRCKFFHHLWKIFKQK